MSAERVEPLLARRFAHGAALAVVLTAMASPPAIAQVPGGRCKLEFTNTPSTRLRSVQVAGGRYESFIGGGVVAHCIGQDVTLTSDSAEYYETRNMIILLGSVHYNEPRARLDSRKLTYFMTDERLYAEGDVFVTLPSGTTMKGPNVEYFRAVKGVRPQSRMWAPQRSLTRLAQKDSAGTPQEPVQVQGDRTLGLNDSLVFLGGRVTIDRSDINSTADSARLDAGTNFAQLVGNGVVRGKGSRAYTLEGSVIDLFTRDRQLEQVKAKGSARAIGRDFDLASDTILMRVDSNRIERAQAWGKKRALVISPGRRMMADSLDVHMPHQHVRLVRALREAFAESDPDSLKIHSKERDWIRGDTIIAEFDSIPPRDTTAASHVKSIIATGAARSYYQMAAANGVQDRPSVNYVRGSLITVRFDSAGVRTVQVDEKAVGLYLEPTRDTVLTASKSTAASAARSAARSAAKSAAKNGTANASKAGAPAPAKSPPTAQDAKPRGTP